VKEVKFDGHLSVHLTGILNVKEDRFSQLGTHYLHAIKEDISFIKESRSCCCVNSFLLISVNIRSRDSVVGIATSYGLDDRVVGVLVPVGSKIFSSPDRPDRL
jgi:hypothetical protein